MKNLKTIAIALIVLGGTVLNAQTKKIDTNKSNIAWVGKKVTGAHNGDVKFSDGALIFKGNTLTGGTFTVDMNSIEVTDLKAGQGKEKLEGHLKNDDFFGTDNHKSAILVFKSVKAKSKNLYTVVADLTIKGKTNPVTFDLATGPNSASTEFKIDRTKYDIKYGSGSFFDNLGDRAINDDFEIKVNLVY